ncbi:MAG: transcription antitermination factor NusB [Planctomycetota bacterium]|nr:MAG: transcription antitermination factor NusB [Planctomycetota bacterium]
MSKRNLARKMAMQELYRQDLLQEEEASIEKLRKNLGDRTKKEEIIDFAIRLIQGYQAHKEEIDSMISQHLENWKLERLSFIDRNILRLGVYELIYCEDIPHQVTINEWVEIAKTYSTFKSGSFINGVLDKIYRKKTEVVKEG